ASRRRCRASSTSAWRACWRRGRRSDDSTAAALRGRGVVALARIGWPDVDLLAAELLTDPEPPVRRRRPLPIPSMTLRWDDAVGVQAVRFVVAGRAVRAPRAAAGRVHRRAALPLRRRRRHGCGRAAPLL